MVPSARNGGSAQGTMPSRAERETTTPDRILRRVEVLAGVYGGVGVVVFLFRSLEEALVLTLAAGLSIVAFRGLQRMVMLLGAAAGGKIDRRSRVLAALRFSLLLLVPLASIWLDSKGALALVSGFSVIPLAFVTEGFVQLFLGMGSRQRDGIS